MSEMKMDYNEENFHFLMANQNLLPALNGAKKKCDYVMFLCW